jgi:alpha-tubulin suppressor-like RCC1 family protein
MSGVNYSFVNNGENLISYSTYNASTWSKIETTGTGTLTTGITAPDGTASAVRITFNNNGNILLRVTIPAFTPNGTDTYTTSFYVRLISGTGAVSTDLADGNPSLDYSSQLVTNQWIRISASGVPTATSKTFVDLISDTNTNYVLDYWGAQLEKKPVAGAYTATNGSTITNDGLTYYFDDVFVPAEIFRKPALWSWGRNNVGQLGTNNIISRSTPVTTILGGTNWKTVACGSQTSMALKVDGTLWLWGDNSAGQLGTNNTTSTSTPVTTILGGSNWEKIDGGSSHSAAIKTDGTLWTWGFNNNGQLGNNDAPTNKNSPITTFLGGSNWKSVACGSIHTAAIKTDGTLWTWGSANNGRLGNNDSSLAVVTPVTTFAGGTDWKSVSVGNHTVTIKMDGTLWVWGSNSDGQLGINNTTQRLTPVTTILGGTNWKTVACGSNFTTSIKNDGTLWLWGRNDFGQLGINNTISRSTPVTTILGGTNWKSVACGGYYVMATKTDGSLWTWGKNSYGQLGDNTLVSRSTPVTTLLGGNNWKSISFGSASEFALAIEYEPDP